MFQDGANGTTETGHSDVREGDVGVRRKLMGEEGLDEMEG